jgi:alpha-glucan,water dikinase
MQKEKITTESGLALLIEKETQDSIAEVIIRADVDTKALLHWGVRRRENASWQVPPEESWPDGSRTVDSKAIQTPFLKKDDHCLIKIRLDSSSGLRSVDFVLFFPEDNRWDNNRGKNYRIDIPVTMRMEDDAALGSSELLNIAEDIIGHETGRNSWTLMHRFNLCYDIIDRVKNSADGLALIFVWLRYSFIRQLDWQRNYNTQPRELGHAMDRLTIKLAGLYAEVPAGREMVRLIMTTLGRGGDAQRVRDEVLNIMHRHHIKEVSGHFMEEWHQKLHNNTTPDDIVICEAYLEFLRSNGNLDMFYNKLTERGVTKGRLESYERPIRSHPDFIPHLKDPLIHDFEHFLGILKAVHTGTDLGTAIHTARYLFDPEMHAMMDFIWHHNNDARMADRLAEKITEARRWIAGHLSGHADRVRDFLFLDIALEDFLRIVVERCASPDLGPKELVDMASKVLENLCITDADEELLNCLIHWEKLRRMDLFGREWSLRARAVTDRIGRYLGMFVDRYNRLFEPKAEYLGGAFQADPWAVDLFVEEVLRGRPAFAMSMLLRYLDPLLRKNARMGDWQVISPGHAAGELEVVEALKSVEGKSFDRPVIIVAEKVTGYEEIPKRVAAILTPAVVDLLSHIAVRARNAGVLFATCYSADPIMRLKSLRGHTLKLGITGGGDVVSEETSAKGEVLSAPVQSFRRAVAGAAFTSYAVTMDEFTEKNVGGKSNHLRLLKGNLPDWIGLPASAALPFGVFEKVLSHEENSDCAKKFADLSRRVGERPDTSRELLDEIRRTILDMKAPRELVTSLYSVMDASNLARPSNWEDAWNCIKRVWASKWNKRAYLSRKANGIPHEDLFMAVLIQKVVEADYSFVIHTVNPISQAKDEIYAEVVLGLGEALVGNYPGKALSFTCKKDGGAPYILSFPSKSEGLYGGGLIFRSDSSGEDLAGFAGAGLYDSFLLPPPKKVTLDYTKDRLLWDDDFRKDVLSPIAGIGSAVERGLGSPQDIEGAYSKGRFYVVQSRSQVGIDNA